MKSKDIIDESRPYIALFIFLSILVFALIWVVQGNDFFLYRVFAPKMEQIRRETFEESKAYNEGMAQELRRMQLEYVSARPDQRAALASVILHQFAGYDTGRLPVDLRAFLDEIKSTGEAK